MFKKFNPKEDVSGSTSLKSSVQRGIRSSLIQQYPFVSQQAYKSTSSSSAQTATPNPPSAPQADTEKLTAEDEDDEENDNAEEEMTKKKKGGKKGGGGKTKEKKSKGKEKEEKKNATAGAGANGAEEEDEGEVSVLDEIWPKKEGLGLTKCHDRISIYTLAGAPLFFNHFDGPYIPTLKLLHQYPAMLPHVQIDRGAIKFLLAGANMMAPGLLSAGGRLPDGLDKDAIVAIHAEGKEHACGIGKMSESSADIKKAGKGVAVEVLCWIGDDFWKIDSIGL